MLRGLTCCAHVMVFLLLRTNKIDDDQFVSCIGQDTEQRSNNGQIHHRHRKWSVLKADSAARFARAAGTVALS